MCSVSRTCNSQLPASKALTSGHQPMFSHCVCGLLTLSARWLNEVYASLSCSDQRLSAYPAIAATAKAPTIFTQSDSDIGAAMAFQRVFLLCVAREGQRWLAAKSSMQSTRIVVCTCHSESSVLPARQHRGQLIAPHRPVYQLLVERAAISPDPEYFWYAKACDSGQKYLREF